MLIGGGGNRHISLARLDQKALRKYVDVNPALTERLKASSHVHMRMHGIYMYMAIVWTVCTIDMALSPSCCCHSYSALLLPTVLLPASLPGPLGAAFLLLLSIMAEALARIPASEVASACQFFGSLERSRINMQVWVWFRVSGSPQLPVVDQALLN